MGFMRIETTSGIWYLVEVGGETYYIPPGLVFLPLEKGETATVDTCLAGEWAEMVVAIQPYVESTIDPEDCEITVWEGWGARYSAPGYMDCTDWCLGDTEEEAIAQCREMYGDEDD